MYNLYESIVAHQYMLQKKLHDTRVHLPVYMYQTGAARLEQFLRLPHHTNWSVFWKKRLSQWCNIMLKYEVITWSILTTSGVLSPLVAEGLRTPDVVRIYLEQSLDVFVSRIDILEAVSFSFENGEQSELDTNHYRHQWPTK